MTAGMFATSIPLRLRQRYNVTGHFLEPESRPGFAIVFASLGLMAGGLIVHPMGFALGELTPLLILSFYLWLAGFGLQILGRDNAALAAKTVALFLLLSMTVMLASAALAPLSRPCVDTMLNHIDGRLFPGFDWPATMKAIGNDPWLGIPLSLAYSSLN